MDMAHGGRWGNGGKEGRKTKKNVCILQSHCTLWTIIEAYERCRKPILMHFTHNTW
jgi:hypothetical protein